jgi:hypothetical protein
MLVFVSLAETLSFEAFKNCQQDRGDRSHSKQLHLSKPFRLAEPDIEEEELHQEEEDKSPETLQILNDHILPMILIEFLFS